MKADEIIQRFCQDITAFNKGEIDIMMICERAAKLGEDSIIDKAMEQYEKELRQFKNILNTVKDGAGKLISVGGSMIQFKRALKED